MLSALELGVLLGTILYCHFYFLSQLTMLDYTAQRQPAHLFPYNIKSPTNCQSQMMLKKLKCEVTEDFPSRQLYNTNRCRFPLALFGFFSESDQLEAPVQLLNPASAVPVSDS